MKRVLLITSGLLFVFGVLRATAQGHPDFSGLWKQNMEKSSKTSLQSYANRIEHNGELLKVTTITGGPHGESSYDRTYVIGKESRTSDREGDRIASIVKWEGTTLVFLTTETETSGTIEMRETWTLSADGKMLTKLRLSHGPSGDSEQHYVLERSPD
jgi:hypothetical protein